jgi:hypothetical protein
MEEKHRAKLDLGTSPTNNTAKKLCQPLGNLIGDPASHLYFTEREREAKNCAFVGVVRRPYFQINMLLPSNIPRKPMNPKKSQQNKLSLKHESQENPLKIETHKLIFVRAGEREIT